jgi:hypothetical protein
LKALLIVFAIVCAWISGAATDGGTVRAQNMAVWFLVLAIVAGLIAWRL